MCNIARHVVLDEFLSALKIAFETFHFRIRLWIVSGLLLYTNADLHVVHEELAAFEENLSVWKFVAFFFFSLLDDLQTAGLAVTYIWNGDLALFDVTLGNILAFVLFLLDDDDFELFSDVVFLVWNFCFFNDFICVEIVFLFFFLFDFLLFLFNVFVWLFLIVLFIFYIRIFVFIVIFFSFVLNFILIVIFKFILIIFFILILKFN